MMTDTEINSGDVAEMLSAKIKTVQETEEALDKKDEAVVIAEPKQEDVNKAEAKQADALVNAPKVIIGAKTSTVRGKKSKDNVTVYLENFKMAPNGSSVKVQALLKMIELIVRLPKKSILDEILAFFKANKNEDFIQEQNALQGITAVDMTQHHRIRIFYTVMIGLARKTATKKNTSVNVIRTIFNSDDIANWVAVQLNNR